MANLTKNARFMAFNQAVRIGAQVFGFMGYARLMTPHDYGLAALAFTVVNFGSILKDLGAPSALIQKKDLTHQDIQGAFEITLLMGVGLAVVISLTASLIAQFMGEVDLQPLLYAVALIFPVLNLGTVHQALMEKKSAFQTVAIIESACALFGLTVGLTCAFFGAGALSIVIQPVAAGVLGAVCYWRVEPWRPALRRSGRYEGLAQFSSFLLLFNFVNYFGRNLDSILIGRNLGPAILGTYNIAYRIMLFPIQNLTSVASRVLFPAFSKMGPDDPQAGPLYLRIVSFISCLTAPLMAGVAMLSKDGLGYLLGARWDGVDQIVFWLAGVGYIQSLVSSTGSIFMSKGKTHIMFMLGTFSTVLYGLVFLLTVNHGVLTLVKGYLAANALNFFVSLGVTLAQLKSSLPQLLRRLLPSLTATALMTAVLFLIQTHVAQSHSLAGVIAQAVIGAITYAITLIILSREQFLGLLKVTGLQRFLPARLAITT